MQSSRPTRPLKDFLSATRSDARKIVDVVCGSKKATLMDGNGYDAMVALEATKCIAKWMPWSRQTPLWPKWYSQKVTNRNDASMLDQRLQLKHRPRRYRSNAEMQ